MKLSDHSKFRFRERTELTRKDFTSLSKLALKKGITLGNIPIEDGYLRKYMSCGTGKYKRFYQGYIFIFSMHQKKLVTVYEANPIYKTRLENIYKRVRGEKKKCTKKKISKSC